MKKILFYIDSMLRGGAQRVMNNLVNHYCTRGFDVVLLNDVEYCDGEYTINCLCKRIILNSTKKSSFFSNFEKIRKIRNILKNEKPEIVISFLGPCNYRILVSSFGLPLKKYVSVRNDPKYEYGEGIRRIFANFLFSFADGCVFQTADAMDYFSKKIHKKSKIILNPVDERFYETNWDGKTNEIVVVGRLQKQKNPILAVNAFEIAHRNHAELKLSFFGNGELKSDILNACENLGIVDCVSIKSNVSDIEKYLSEARMFLMTSDFEGLPNALMEAMSVGVPCICTDCPCGGPKYLLNDEELRKLLCKCGDEIDIAEKIGKLLDDDFSKKISILEKKQARKFNPSVIYNEWDEFLGVDA